MSIVTHTPWRGAPRGLTPERALAAVSHMPGAVLVRYQGTWVVTANPVESVAGSDCWHVLDRPFGDTPARSPIVDGWIGLFAYDAAGMVEALPVPLADPGGPAPARLSRYAAAIVIDDDGGWRVTGVSSVAIRPLVDALAGPRVDAASAVPTSPPTVETSLPDGDYRHAIDRVRALIAAGDCYQVNLAQRLSCAWPHGAPTFAARLWGAAGPSANRAYVALPEGVVISASPELLVRSAHEDGRVFVLSSPIKGTARRDDAALLSASPKDRAEHVMIVDLIRNDVGRVARSGSVRVTRFGAPLATSYASHLVSDVTGELTPDARAADVVRAVFPGGSVTGCPKIRAMEVIRDLEPVSRGPAFGSVIAMGRDGSLDASVLIRTAWLSDGTLRYWSGGAIVWDSEPGQEVAEAWLKAEPFLRAVGAAR
ncbi:MAG: anthranilate synthase component I family protein [Actinobacteria bacterium]|nr:anthranilate synthase component I family protein [Actinomycetota bacterium]